MCVRMHVSLHFPFAPQYYQKHCFQRFRKEDVQKHRVLRDVWQKDAGSRAKKPAGGIEPGTPVCDTGSPKTTFSGTSSNCRAVRGGPPPCGCFPIQLISRNHLAQGPFCAYHCIINDRVKQKNLCRPLTGLSTRQSTRDNPSYNHPHWHIGLSPE